MVLNQPLSVFSEKPLAHHTETGTSAMDDSGVIKNEALDLSGINDEGRKATETEHGLSVTQAIRIYSKAVGWSLLVSMAIVMDGYDTSLLSTLYAFPAFQQKYGSPFQGGYQLSAAWQAGLSVGATIGKILGIFLNGYVCERFGYKRVMLCGYVVMMVFILILFFAPSTAVLLVGELLCGIPWGVFTTLPAAYASEVTPLVLRGYLTSFINLCWVFGQLIAAGVLQSFQHSHSDEWAYRIPFAIQWIWPVPLFVAMSFAPESPWWLVRQGRIKDAENSLKRLSKESPETNTMQTLAMMVHTNELEKEVHVGTSYWDCLKSVDRRRTEICTMAWASQTLAGLIFAQFATYFFQQAGMNVSDAFKMNLGYNGLAVVGTVLSWLLITYLGRRTVYLSGLTVLTSLMFIIGFLSLAPSNNQGSIWAQATLLLVWIFFYDLTIGPVAFIVVSETSATRLRGKTLAIARNTQNLCSILAYIVNPYMLNPTEANWKGKTGFFWGSLSLCCTLWCFFRLPECKGRTYEELDILFQKRVKARDFKLYKIDAYQAEGNTIEIAK